VADHHHAGTGAKFRITIPILGALATLLLLLSASPARAAHDLGYQCYVCHNIKSGQVWTGSNSIWTGKNIGMPSYAHPITCDICHTEYGAKFTGTNRSNHPVRIIAGTATSVDNTYPKNYGVALDCKNCHAGTGTVGTPDLSPDVAPTNYTNLAGNTVADGYPNHDNTIAADNVTAIAYNFQNVVTTAGTSPHLTGNLAYTHAPSAAPGTDYAFCFSCHDGSTNTARQDNVLKSYTVGGGHYYKNSAPTGGAVGNKLACSDCHATHNSTASSKLLQIPNGGNTAYQTITFTNPSSPTAADIRAVCNACHAEYLAKGTAPTAGTTPLIRNVRPMVRPNNIADHAPAATASCYACHSNGAHDPGASCNGCHGDANLGGNGAPPYAAFSGISPWPSAGVVDNINTPARIGDHRNVPEVAGLDCSAHTSFGCEQCHTTTPGSGATHNEASNANASMTQISTHNWYTGAAALWDPGANAGSTAVTGSVVDDSCSNIDCHSPFYNSNAGKSGTVVPYKRYWINKTLWDCYTCHAYDGKTGTTRPASGSKLDNTMSTGVHGTHVDNNNIACADCHAVPANMTAVYTAPHKNGGINVNFNATHDPYNAAHAYSVADNTAPTDDNASAVPAHRSWGNCSNVYCHSIGQKTNGTALTGLAGEYKTPMWDNEATGNCGTCHGGNGIDDNVSSRIASASHTQHVNTAPYSFACTMCHANSGRGSTNHVDNAVDLQFGTLNGIPVDCTAYSQGKKHIVGNGFGTCTTNYCHGTDPVAARRLTGGANQATGTTNLPTWGTATTGNCGSCHGAPGATTNYAPATYVGTMNWPGGWHARHLDPTDNVGPRLGTTIAACLKCHTAETVSTHVDGKVDFRTRWDNASVTTLALTQVCDPCHGTGVAAAKAQWDNTSYALNCLTCHGATAAYTNDNATGRTAPNVAGDNSNYGAAVLGHNRPSSSGAYPQSANAAANLACSNCHKLSILHINGVDDNTYSGNRLWDNANGVTGITTITNLCGACHKRSAQPTSPLVQNWKVVTHGNDNASTTFKNGTTHDNAADYFAYNCDACHEPHGLTNNARLGASSNIFMTKTNIEVKNYSFPAGGDNGVLTVGPIYFEALTGNYSFDDNTSATNSRVCVACHVSANRSGGSTTTLVNTGGAHAGLDAYGGDERGNNCASCHNHNMDDNIATNDGLMPQQCNGCHSYPGLDNTGTNLRQMSAGHRDHVGIPGAGGTANSRAYNCTLCHYSYNHNQAGIVPGGVWTAYNAATHLNVRFDNSWNPGSPTYNGVNASTASAPGNGGTGVCAALYCHGDVASQTTWGGSYTKPRWDNTAGVTCGTCHTASTALAQGNHPAHLTAAFGPGSAAFTAGGTCSEGTGCHTAYGLTPASTHVNNQVSFRNYSTPTDNAAVALSATSACNNCHTTSVVTNETLSGAQLAKNNWDNTTYKLRCTTCHNGTAWQNMNGSGDRGNNVEATYYANGHGAASIDNASTGTVSGNVQQTVPVRCEMCHREDSAHIGTSKDAINPWRLDNTIYGFTATANGIDNYCMTQCHANTAAARHAWIVNTTGTAGGVGWTGKDNTVDTHPSSMPVMPSSTVWTGFLADMSRWFLVPADGNLPFLDNLPAKAPAARTGNSVFLCVTCHDPHGVGTVLTPTRAFSGTNTEAAGSAVMLRYNYSGTGLGTSPLCAKCHR
jgi:predicted CxxxxCH...CXXCH cytochrome family protein